MELRVLGPVEVWVGGRPGNLSKRQHRLILGILAIEANRPVPGERLIDLLWGERPPKHPRAVLHSRISELRVVLETLTQADDQVRLLTHGGSYALQIPPERVDVHEFSRLVAQSRAAGSDEAVRGALRRALRLWRGPVLGGWLPSRSFEALCRAFESSRLTAAEDLFEAELRLGEHSRIVDEILELSTAHPGRDRLTAALMLALHRSGRTAEATAAYDRHRRLLGEEYGVDPGRRLQELHVAILRGDPGLVAENPNESNTVYQYAPPVPRQLPTAVRHFVGREAELRALGDLIGQPVPNSGAVVISSINGTAGIGKTALAVSWAHRVADQFIDGQLYVNLRGFDPSGSPMSPAEAVRGFLDALQVPPQQIPASLDAQLGLYRSLLATRRVLVVLDNARDAEQVRPLLPGSPGCLVLVTSRNQLPGLVAVEGAAPLTLDLLSTDDARLLLVKRLGADRVNAEPAAVQEIIARCAGLPLALAIVAARAATRPEFALSVLAEQLGETRGRLDVLTGGDAASDLRAAFSWSYRALRADAARLYRLMGLHPGPDISAAAAASLAGLPAARVRSLLAELVGANLVVEHTPGRYTLHDLLRVYAADLTHAVDTDDQRHAAAGRLLDHYLHTGYTATLLLNPHREPINAEPPRPGTVTEHPADHGQAMDWFAIEHPVLLAAVEYAATAGWDTHTWQLAWTLYVFLDRQGYWHDQAAVQQAAADAGGRCDNPSAQADAHRYAARALNVLGRFDEAAANLGRALDLNRQSGDQNGQAKTHLHLAEMWGRRGRAAKAVRHAQQALDLFRLTGHPVGQAHALNTVGWLNGQIGQYREALTACGQALTRFQELDDSPGQAATWDSLGFAHHHLGHHTQAIACYQRALDLYRQLGDRHGEFGTLTCLGDAHRSAGHLRAARTAWQQALAILTDLRHPEADRVRAKLAGG